MRDLNIILLSLKCSLKMHASSLTLLAKSAVETVWTHACCYLAILIADSIVLTLRRFQHAVAVGLLKSTRNKVLLNLRC